MRRRNWRRVSEAVGKFLRMAEESKAPIDRKTHLDWWRQATAIGK